VELGSETTGKRALGRPGEITRSVLSNRSSVREEEEVWTRGGEERTHLLLGVDR
jgi:hypothetical protein